MPLAALTRRGARRGALLLLLLGLLSCPPTAGHAQAQPEAETQTAKPASDDPSFRLPNTTGFEMTSRAGGAYRIFVHWPEGDPPEAGWPILYLLDGDVYFPIAATLAWNLSANPANSGVEPGIVVSIGYPDESRRDIDYTPRTPARPDDANPYIYPDYETGGAEAFLAFIEDELKPRIQQEWRVDRGRQALSGHAFGGLFTLHAYFTRPESFSTYIASSPSIWFWGRHILAAERAYLARHTRPEGRLLAITAAEYAQSLPLHQAIDPAFDARLLDNGERRMIDNAREMVWRLRHAGLNVDWRMFEGENQMSVAYPALGHAISLAFRRQR